jgi:stage II sporulation protein D
MGIRLISGNICFFILSFLLFWNCTPRIQKTPGTKSPVVRVLLNEIKSLDSLVFTDSYYLYSEEARYEFGERNQKLYIALLSDGLRLYNRNRNLIYNNHSPIVLKPADERSHFIFNNNEYAGDIIFIFSKNSSLYMINRIPLEEYLKGVVPAEIIATKPALFEAVKAQAICARTYAIKKMTENKNKEYDLMSTIQDQVYSGFKNHTSISENAIEETRNIIIKYKDKPATIYYHSTCGGKLEAVQNVWSQPVIPYLQGGSDAVSDVYLCSKSPYFRWIEKRSIDQMDSLFYFHFGKSYLKKSYKDTVKIKLSLEISGRDSSGRITELKAAYADTTLNLAAYEIRKFFGWPPGKYLKSTLFYIEQDSDSSMVLVGGGSGHGVGMCQWGAMNMAERGFRYYHILSKYFPGTKLARID